MVRLPLVQRLIIAFTSPSRASDIEAHSRSWVMKCECGVETSIWDMGGVRYKAIGEQRTMGRCKACGKTFFGKLYRRHRDMRDDA